MHPAFQTSFLMEYRDWVGAIPVTGYFLPARVSKKWAIRVISRCRKLGTDMNFRRRLPKIRCLSSVCSRQEVWYYSLERIFIHETGRNCRISRLQRRGVDSPPASPSSRQPSPDGPSGRPRRHTRDAPPLAPHPHPLHPHTPTCRTPSPLLPV